MTNLLQTRSNLKREQLERVRELMDAHVRDYLFENYQDLIEALELPNPRDRHVVAAAIRGQADIIVIFNLKDFPAHMLTNYGIEAQHPDEFVSHLVDMDEFAVLKAVQQQRRSLRNPPVTPDDFVARLHRLELVQMATHVQRVLDCVLESVTGLPSSPIADPSGAGAGTRTPRSAGLPTPRQALEVSCGAPQPTGPGKTSPTQRLGSSTKPRFASRCLPTQRIPCSTAACTLPFLRWQPP